MEQGSRVARGGNTGRVVRVCPPSDGAAGCGVVEWESALGPMFGAYDAAELEVIVA